MSLDADAVVKLIYKGSMKEDKLLEELMTTFTLTKIQAQVIMDMYHNTYVTGERRFYSSLTPAENLKKAIEGLQYDSVWADLEDAKLVMTKVRVNKNDRPAFISSLKDAIVKCQDCQNCARA
jgi:hypothetical protein